MQVIGYDIHTYVSSFTLNLSPPTDGMDPTRTAKNTLSHPRLVDRACREPVDERDDTPDLVE